MSERGPEINISTEKVLKAVNLSRTIERNKVLGDSSQESAEKAREILGGSFAANYQSVEEMINTTKDLTGKTDIQRKNAEEALNLLGSAMCLTENGKANDLLLQGKLGENLPSNLVGIEKYVAENLLVSGDGDKVGKEIVANLIDLEKINRRAILAPKAFAEKRGIETKRVIEILCDKFDEIDPDSKDGLKIGAVVGCLDSGLVREVDPSVRRKVDIDDEVDYEPIVIDPETQETRGGARWEISPENAAMAMKFMDSSMRWQSYTPPEWFKKIKPILNKDGSVKESTEEIQSRIEYMVMVNDGAASMSYAGKDLDKIQGNRMWFAFDNEKFTKLFNEDFKLVSSKMLNDLCELYEDKNGRMSLRYKEGINKKGHQGIKASVENKLEGIRDYKEEMADFLAKQNGRKEANYMDKMNAYTAWNLFYMFGDSSLADRTRVMPTYGGIINDGMRTLNPEYKAKSKWKVFKEEKDIFEAEYFGGSLADYALTVMRVEKELGKPIDGKKTLREKITDGEMKIFDNKMCYGFFDFTYGTRDLCKPNGEKFTKEEDVTVSTLLMNYARFDDEGKLINRNENGDFSFGTNQVDFLNLFRDQIETAALSYNCMMGKKEVKSVEGWVHDIKDKVGMVRGIRINGKPTYKYTTSPDYWANMILGSFGADTTRLSSDYIYVKTPKEVSKSGYNLFLYKLLVQDLNISNADVDINSVMRYMGVNVKGNEDPRGFRLTIVNDAQRERDIRKTEKLYRQLNKRAFN
ncbi:MAG: hypothetical protein PHP97_02395 [Candidatus Shapirobacteria bacterium]|nr:hypothetical protein [Candidatus Shapirobacteria bacterium]MDD3002681.1 hypothetical protein [Candidatus Shapirobacteria bacterium]MDD4382885.1 hypothetical protein [Candidatus Shapirobacteria bacterium]